MIKCIICKKELTYADPGIIHGGPSGYASSIPINYVDPISMAYHDRCKEEGFKLYNEKDLERLRKMGVIE